MTIFNKVLKQMSAIAVTVLLLTTSQLALADCETERKAVLDATAALATASANQRTECGDLRLCKSDCRLLKKECKAGAKAEKSVCIDECTSTLSGKQKRQCKKDCRSGKRLSKASCRNTMKHCKGSCQAVHKTAECRTARSATTTASIAASAAGVALSICLK